MTYYESAADIQITLKRALQELKRHGIDDPEEFFETLGQSQTYQAQDVLDWLGY